MKYISLILLFYATCQFGFAQTYIGDQEDIDQILNNIKQFSEHVMNSDYEKIGAAYTQDGKIFPSNRRIIAGQEKITDYWRLPEGMEITHHKIIPSEIKVIGEEAYDYGYYEGTTKMADGKESSWKGKYVIVWKKLEGEWLIYLDIWNRVNE